MKQLSRTLFSRKRLTDILGVFLFYFFFSFIYHIVLWYTAYGYENEGFWGWVSIKEYWFSSGMQYVFFFIASLCIWFIGIYLLRSKKTKYQILMVMLLIPPTVYVVREMRYDLVDKLGLGRLQHPGTAWDLYIPLLFFFIQFGCFFAYRYFKENQKKLIVEGELRQAALKSELAAIKAQLNPHFLYNVFNTINASVPPENENTRNMIGQLSDLFRYQLMASKKEMVTLRQELEFVNKYLDLEKERFKDRLKIHINVPDELMEEKIPPMLLQPLVENSVKHGLSSLIEGGAISIRIYRESEKLKFEISDTGVGIQDKQKVFDKGIGLTNTQLRLHKMYQSQLQLLDNKPQGLTVKFAI